MHIGFIVQTLDGGGAERVVSVLSSQFARTSDYKCTVVIFFPMNDEYSTDKHVHKIYLFETEAAYRSSSKIERIKRIRSVIKKQRFEAVFPFLWFVGIYTEVACTGMDVRVIQTIRNNPDLVPHSKFARLLRDWSLKKSAGVFCQNQDQYDSLHARLGSKLRIVPNPVAEDFFELDIEPSKNEKIVMFGRLEKQKNYPMMIRAVQSLMKYGRNLRIEIYGAGKLYGDLQKQIDQAGLHDSIKLMGRTDNPSDAMRDAALFVMTSSFEGMPNSLMEAMAAGLPCISTNCPTGPADLIDDGVNGYLVSNDDDHALADRIEELLEDNALRDRIGAAAKSKIASLYRPEQLVYRLINCFLL